MSQKRPMCVFALTFMLCLWGFLELCGGIDLSENAADKEKTVIEGIIEDKAYKNFSNIIYIKCETGKYVVYLDKQDISEFKIGQTVRVCGTYSDFPVAENSGQFDMRKYYRIRGYEARLKKAAVTHASKSYSAYRNTLFNIKDCTKSIYKDNMSDEYSGTVCAMVLGDKSELDDETKTLYQNVGISHILSLSGLHIATVGLVVFSMLIKAGLGTKLSSVISTFIMVSYGIMTGLSTSTFRALIMFLLGILARCIGRTYDLLSAVCISVVIILAENPLYIYDSGFLMSFLSVIGIGVIYPVLNEVMQGYSGQSRNNRQVGKNRQDGNIKQDGNNVQVGSNKQDENDMRHDVRLCKPEYVSRLINAVRQSVCISMSATLATLPVVMSSFYKISRYGIFVNIIIVPAMSVVLFAGIAGGIIGNIAGIRDILIKGAICVRIGEKCGLHKITGLVLQAVEFLLGRFNDTSSLAGSIPGNTWVIGKPEGIGIIVYIILLTLAYFPLDRKVCEKIAGVIYSKKSYRKKGINDKEPKDNNISDAKIYCAYVFILTIAAVSVISYRHKNDFEIDVLSVGQGACNIIHGKDVPTVLIDAGSTDVKEAGKYRVIPNMLSKGIDEIDYIFVTHPDEDHISAVKELLSDETSGIKAGALVFSIVDEEILKNFGGYGVPVYSFNAGQVIENDKYEIKAIYPSYDANAAWHGDDANEKSLVLKITHKPSGLTTLFTGDIGTTAEDMILQECFNGSKDISNIDFMTIAHHGSKNSSSEQFLAYANPLFCTISAGRDNSYGHPHKETLEKLDAYNIPYLITYETGEVSVNVNKGRVWMERFLE